MRIAAASGCRGFLLVPGVKLSKIVEYISLRSVGNCGILSLGKEGIHSVKRVLIADGNAAFSAALKKQLKKDFDVQLCGHADGVLDMIGRFEPDVLLVDMAFDAPQVLKALRTSGRQTQVVVTMDLKQDFMIASASRWGVAQFFRKPARLGWVVSEIRDLCMDLSQQPWCAEDAVDEALLILGFRMGLPRYRSVKLSVLEKCNAPDISAMKGVYPAVARKLGGTWQKVEKAVRDAIADAWEDGDEACWRLYFPPGKDGICQCPVNEEFLAKMAYYLRRQIKFQKPYIPPKAQ